MRLGNERPRAGAATVMIRAATPADLQAIGQLGALLVRPHHDLDPARFIAATPQTPRAYASYLGTQMEEPSVLVLVAEQDGDILGYSYAGVEGTDYMALRGPAGMAHDLVVDPAHRGQGIAERNEAAQRLFGCAGFRQTMVEMTRESRDEVAAT